jgi:hypothetical protein
MTVAGPVSAEGYVERLSSPWWAHPVVVAMAVIIALESSFLAITLWGQALVIVAFAVSGELIVWRYGSKVVEVRAGTVRAGSWRLPIERVRGVAVLDQDKTRSEMRRRDDDVYRCTRGWIRQTVMLEVDDPDDLPYWLVSTRHPYLLAAALADEAERIAAASASA